MFSLLEARPLIFDTFKLGKQGWTTVVCQIVLNGHYKAPLLRTDGIFGPATDKAARQVQEACHVVVDGVVGPKTQEAFVKAKCRHAEARTTPPGLLAGLCNIESSYSWAAVSPENSNGSHDYGCTQDSLVSPTVDQLTHAFDPDASTHVLAGETAGFHRAVLSRVGGRRAWELAALNHNWPQAALALANGNEAWLDQPFNFTTAKGYATGLAYANHYIDVATDQVTDWSVA
jgi:hypothetical protein